MSLWRGWGIARGWLTIGLALSVSGVAYTPISRGDGASVAHVTAVPDDDKPRVFAAAMAAVSTDARPGELTATADIQAIGEQAFRVSADTVSYLVPIKYASLKASNKICVLLVLNESLQTTAIVRLGGDDFDGDGIVPSCDNVLGVAFHVRAQVGELDGVFLVSNRIGQQYRRRLVVVSENAITGTAAFNAALTHAVTTVSEPQSVLPALKILKAH